MNIDKFEQQVLAARQRLDSLHQDVDNSVDTSNKLQEETFAELSITSEELKVAVEELKQQNEALLASRQQLELERQRYLDLFEFAPDGYLETDEQAIIQEANKAAAVLLNTPQKYLIGKPLDIFVSVGDRTNPNSQWSRVIKSFAKYCNSLEYISKNNQDIINYSANKTLVKNCEISLQPREQKPLPVALSVSATRNDRGQVLSLRWLLRNLSARKQAEEKMRQQAALLDVATDAILVCDLDGKILFWNLGAARLYGWEQEEVLEKNVTQLLYRGDVAELAQYQQELLENGSWHGELNQIARTGKKIVVESRWSLVRDKENNPQSILVVNTDITLAKQLETRHLRSQRLESLGSLSSGIAHDLNNILTPILNITYYLQREFFEGDNRAQEVLKVLEINARRGAALIEQLLKFARGAEGQRVLVPVTLLLSEVELLAKETFPKSIAIQKETSEDFWAIRGDFTQLHQVVMNLCLNARDAMPNGGTLTIRAKDIVINKTYARLNLDARIGPHIVITIADTGNGIAPELLERIFDPFFTTKELGQGTGLGLAIAANIVKNHGGFIDVTSEIAKGTQFNVFLPAVKIAPEASPSQPNLPQGDKTSILVVDDEPFVCSMSETFLKSCGYQVLIAKNGNEAIALYAKHRDRISAVLMDVMMPSMSGASAIVELTKIDPQVKIIAISGLDDSCPQISEALRTNVKAFLRKPHTAESLLTTLHKVINS
jgi:two-component system, cell cycle sensor histidine kinase and response regulator CckA